MRAELFRREALTAQQDPPYGNTLAIRPLPARSLTVLALAMTAGLLVFASWGEYTKKAHVSGYLAPNAGLIKVFAPELSTVADVRVREGDQVARGDVLLVLSTERSSLETVATQAAALAKLAERRASLAQELDQQADIDRIQALNLDTRIRALTQELAQADAELSAQGEQLRLARDIADQYRTLFEKRFVALVQVRQKQAELADLQAKLEATRRTRLTLQRQLNEAQAERDSSSLKFDNQRAAIRRNIAELDQQRTDLEARRSLAITAPSSGTVTTILVAQGQTASPNSALLSILPNGAALEAQLLVPTRSIGFIRPGQSVALRYQAFPYQRFGSHEGRVTQITRTLLKPEEGDVPVRLQDPVYRVSVALDDQTVSAYGQRYPLQAGMLLDADVRLDRRRIVEWLFDPLLSLTGKL